MKHKFNGNVWVFFFSFPGIYPEQEKKMASSWMKCCQSYMEMIFRRGFRRFGFLGCLFCLPFSWVGSSMVSGSGPLSMGLLIIVSSVMNGATWEFSYHIIIPFSSNGFVLIPLCSSGSYSKSSILRNWRNFNFLHNRINKLISYKILNRAL